MGGDFWRATAQRHIDPANRFVPLALVLIGPVIVNILCFHTLLRAPGLSMATVLALLRAILAIQNQQHLAGIFVQRT